MLVLLGADDAKPKRRRMTDGTKQRSQQRRLVVAIARHDFQRSLGSLQQLDANGVAHVTHVIPGKLEQRFHFAFVVIRRNTSLLDDLHGGIVNDCASRAVQCKLFHQAKRKGCSSDAVGHRTSSNNRVLGCEH